MIESIIAKYDADKAITIDKVYFQSSVNRLVLQLTTAELYSTELEQALETDIIEQLPFVAAVQIEPNFCAEIDDVTALEWLLQRICRGSSVDITAIDFEQTDDGVACSFDHISTYHRFNHLTNSKQLTAQLAAIFDKQIAITLIER